MLNKKVLNGAQYAAKGTKVQRFTCTGESITGVTWRAGAIVTTHDVMTGGH